MPIWNYSSQQMVWILLNSDYDWTGTIITRNFFGNCLKINNQKVPWEKLTFIEDQFVGFFRVHTLEDQRYFNTLPNDHLIFFYIKHFPKFLKFLPAQCFWEEVSKLPFRSPAHNFNLFVLHLLSNCLNMYLDLHNTCMKRQFFCEMNHSLVNIVKETWEIFVWLSA